MPEDPKKIQQPQVPNPQDVTLLAAPLYLQINGKPPDVSPYDIMPQQGLSDQTPVGLVGDFILENNVTDDERKNIQFRGLLKDAMRPITNEEVEVADIILSEMRAGRAVLAGEEPAKLTPYQRLAKDSPAFKYGMNYLRGVNEDLTMGVLRALGGAERFLSDYLLSPRMGFWGMRAGPTGFDQWADYMQQSIDENWSPTEKESMVGRLTYNLGRFTPFIGELMLTPEIRIGQIPVGKLPLLMGTQEAAIKYGETGKLGETALAGAGGAATGFAFELLGYGTGKLAEGTQTILAPYLGTGATDVAIASHMFSSGLGFGGYEAASQFLQYGEIRDWDEVSAQALFGTMLTTPGVAQHAFTRAANNYLRLNAIDMARIRYAEKNEKISRKLAEEKFKQAEDPEVTKEEKNRLLVEGKMLHDIADATAMEVMAQKNPDGLIEVIRGDKKLSDTEKEEQVARVKQTNKFYQEQQKLEENAVPERSTEKVDVGASSTNGQKMAKGNTQGEKAPVSQKEKAYVAPETSEKFADLTIAEDGDYLFYHYSPERREVIEPSEAGTNKTAITGREETAAGSLVGGMSHYYTNTSRVEKGVGEVQHVVKVAPEKVYDFNKDPLNFYDEARKQFEANNPGMAFGPNQQLAYITKLAGENGYDMVLADWGGGTRANSTKPLTPVKGEVKGTRATDLGYTKEGREAVRNPELAQVRVHEQGGGSTFSVAGEDLGKKGEGGVVSIFPERQQEIEGELTPQDIRNFKEKNQDLYKGNEDVLAVGTWKDGKKNVLDVSTIIPILQAVELGKQYNQKAVFDLAKMEDVATGGTGEATGAEKPEAERIQDIRALQEGTTGGGGAKPPAKPPKGGPPQLPELPGGEPEKKRSVGQLIDELRSGRKAAMTKLRQRSKHSFSYLFYDQQETAKRKFLKAQRKANAGGIEAQRVVWRMNEQKGAKAWAEHQYLHAMKSIYGPTFRMISPKLQALWSDYADMKRTAELYRSRPAFGKTILKEEGGRTQKEVEDYLMAVRQKDPVILKKYGLKDYDYQKLREGMDRLQDEYNRMLDEKLEQNIITQAAYDQIKFEHPFYSPRKYIDLQEKLDPNGSLSGIQTLKGGSEEAKIVDIGSLMWDAVSRHENIKFRTNAMRAIETFAKNVPNDFVRKAKYTQAYAEKLKVQDQLLATQPGASKKTKREFIEPKFEKTPDGMEAIDYIDKNGRRQRMFMNSEVRKYFDIEPFTKGAQQAMEIIGWMTGTKPLKMVATGYNPEFLVKNIPLDIMHILLTTDAYTGFLPLDVVLIHKDMALAAKDAALRTGTWLDYLEEGGGMKMLTGQGQLREGRSRKWTRPAQVLQEIENFASYFGETSESITRLALRNHMLAKYKKQYLKDYGKEATGEALKELQRDATGYARNYLDFEQGGRIVKAADSAMPYLNAGFEVTRGALRAAGNNPALFSVKVLQLAAMASAITAWNMGMFKRKDIDEDTQVGMRNAYENDVSDEVKARNFVLMTPVKYKDANGTERYLYVKFQKDNAQELITGLAEDAVRRHVLGEDAVKYTSPRRLKELAVMTESFTNIAQLPPTVKAILGYTTNRDFFYGGDLWYGEDLGKDKSLEQYPTTPERYKFVGKIPLPGGHKLSPVRTQYAAKQVFTEGNVIATGIGELMDKLFLTVQKDSTTYEPGRVERFKNTPAIRRFVKATYPGVGRKKDSPQFEYNRVRTYHNQQLDALIRNQSSPEEIYKYLDNIVEKGDEKTPAGSVMAIDEMTRLENRYIDEIERPAVAAWVKSLESMSPIPRAEELFNQWVHLHPKLQQQLIESAVEDGLMTETTELRFIELQEEYVKEMEKMEQERKPK